MNLASQAIARTVAVLVEGLRRGGSDVHFTPGTTVRVRVEGSLVPVQCDPEPWSAENILHSWVWLSAENAVPVLDFFKRPDDRTVRVVNLPDLPGTRVRLHAKKMQGGMGYTVRMLPDVPRELSSLDLPESLIRLCETRGSGIILVCGATGEGKSTTSYALVNHLVTTQNVKAITFESPVEVLIPNQGKRGLVQQHELPTDLPDYDVAQSSSLRDDPDIVFYSELLTDEAIQKAVQEANTGHLVFGTLHTGTAAQSLMRLMAARPKGSESSYLQDLAGSLVAVLCQRLVKGQDGKRIPNYELLVVDAAVAGVMVRGDFKQLDNAITTGGDSGMLSFDKHLANLVDAKRLTVETALAGSPRPRETITYFAARQIIGRAEEERLKSIYVV